MHATSICVHIFQVLLKRLTFKQLFTQKSFTFIVLTLAVQVSSNSFSVPQNIRKQERKAYGFQKTCG